MRRTVRASLASLLWAATLLGSGCKAKAPPPAIRVAPVIECPQEWLASLGFDVENPTLLHTLAQQLASSQTEFLCKEGAYLPLECGERIQLWFQRSLEGVIVAAHPHYEAPGRFDASVVRKLHRSAAPALTSSFLGWLTPDPHDPALGKNPVVFACPAAELDCPPTLPAYRRVQLLAFAERITAYPSFAAFKRDRNLRLGPEQIYPQGLYSQKGIVAANPPTRVTMTARVVDFGTHINPTSGLPYLWARVRSRGRTFDMVGQPSVLQGTLQRGGIVLAVCDLSGRVLNH